MKIKVCGLNNPDNIEEVAKLDVDILGFIFYKKSPRCYNDSPVKKTSAKYLCKIEKAGVFVNANEYDVLATIEKYQLNYVQLHGEEKPAFCLRLKEQTKVIKAIPVHKKLSMYQINKYHDVCDYYLFDTKTKNKGGSGQKFDWRLLSEYEIRKPFFLSGGIGIEDAVEIKKLQLPMLYGVDINSKFELFPGTKNIQLIKKFISKIKK